jgi:hypothetical protein
MRGNDMEKAAAVYIATKAPVESGERITSNMTGQTNTFLFAFFNNGIPYVRILDTNGVQRNAYARNYGIKVMER